MKKIKVSIIVPVYNSEKYLKKCLNSLLKQTLEDIEIICVDDGSTDSSPKILNDHSNNDNRIKIITQENKDVGAARGAGVKIAKGEYIAFVDNDDWLALDAIEKLYFNAKTNDSDITMLKVAFYFSDSDIAYPSSYDIAKYFDDGTNFDNFVFKASDIKEQVMNMSFAPWFKFYKSEFLKDGDFYFKENITYPDVPLHVQVMLRAGKISFCPETLYFYRREHEESMLLISKDSDRIFDIFAVIDEVENFLNDNGFMKGYYTEFLKFKIEQIKFWFFRCGKSYHDKYFEKSKEEFVGLILSEKIIEKIPKKYSKFYFSVLNSNSYHEVELYNEVDIGKSDNKKTRQKQRNGVQKCEEGLNSKNKKIKNVKNLINDKITNFFRKITKLLKI